MENSEVLHDYLYYDDIYNEISKNQEDIDKVNKMLHSN